MTGLVPVISIEVAKSCHDHRDRRVKPGDDNKSHCEPTGPRAVARPDDRLREAIQRSMQAAPGLFRRFAPRNDANFPVLAMRFAPELLFKLTKPSALRTDLRQRTPAVDTGISRSALRATIKKKRKQGSGTPRDA